MLTSLPFPPCWILVPEKCKSGSGNSLPGEPATGECDSVVEPDPLPLPDPEVP